MYEIFHYLTVDGRDPFQEWLESLRDRQAKARVAVRLNRMAAGNLGDHKPVGGGVWELRIDVGPGYRVYYSLAGQQLVLLLTGGDKSSQRADIEKAMAYWGDHQRRHTT